MGRFGAILAVCAVVAAPALAAPVGGQVAEAALYSPKGAQAVVLRTPGLKPEDVEALRQVAATQKYYGAVAISPDEGLLSPATVAAANYHDVENARAAALASCNDRRKKGADRCVVVADIVPVGWKKGAKLQLSTDATAGFEALKGPRFLAASADTGNWGAGADAAAALAACRAKSGARDCELVISD